MAVNYTALLSSLLPPGHVLRPEPGTVVLGLLDGFAQEMGRVDAQLASLLVEADPRQASALLADWEALAGLPDCVVTTTEEERRAAVVARLTMEGRQDPAWYVELAAVYGWTVQVEEYTPFTCESECTAPLTQDEDVDMTCESACNSPLRSYGWRFWWMVRQLDPAVEVTFMTCDSKCTSPLSTWGNAGLECMINRTAPAHTLVQFAYGEVT